MAQGFITSSKDQPHQDREALLSDDELLTHYQTFWNAFIFPGNLNQLNSVNSSLFAEDITGRVDVTRTYVGRELNTEYIFGSFSDNNFNPNVTTLLGAPLFHETIQLAIQKNLIFSSELILFNTSLVDDVVPVEIYMWMLFNERGEIRQYDITFRWFDWLFQNMLNYVQGNTSLNNDEPLHLRMVRETCQTALDYCTGASEQYNSYDQCQDFLTNKIRFGASYEFGRNTLLCRHLHAKILPLRPEFHCPHVGPSGGDMCIDDLVYHEVVLQTMFVHASEDMFETLRPH